MTFRPGQTVQHKPTGRLAIVERYTSHDQPMVVRYTDCRCLSSVDPHQFLPFPSGSVTLRVQ